MRIYLLFFFFLLSSLMIQPPAAHADNLVKLELIAESKTLEPGQDIWVGLHQNIEPEWHTYWAYPGDSGTPPRITWSLPKNFSMSEINWPVPHKMPYGSLLNYGYEHEVTLLQKLNVPENLPDGQITLEADVEILVCKEECIPEFSSLSITFNDGSESVPEHAALTGEALASLPQGSGTQEATFTEHDGNLVLTINTGETRAPETIAFFPLEWGLIDNPSEPTVEIEGSTLIITQKRGDRSLTNIETFPGVLRFETDTGEKKILSVSAAHRPEETPAQQEASNTTKASPENINDPALDQALNDTHQTTLFGALLLAFLGGLILNLMPCVFPVLSIKALSLVKIAEKHPALARAHGLVYTAGVILSFVAIAGLLILFKAGGAEIGWGFQLQDPVVVTLLAYLLFLIGLNLFGFFEISSSFGNIGNKLTNNQGLSGSFFTGILATLVATPCTAPFMAGAIGFALTQSASVALIIFAALGFGLAFPYLVLAAVPAMQAVLPKPGAWMNTFRQFLAFPMFASAAWLVWVLSQQAGSMGVLGALMGALAIAFGLWLFKHRPKNHLGNLIVKVLAVLCIAAALGFLPAGTMDKPDTTVATAQDDAELISTPYTPEVLENALTSNDPVFVEMTAAWCITCKVNHASSINVTSTRALFKDQSVRYIVGDWTNYDPAITKFLDAYGRNGVPIYVFYGAPEEHSGMRPDPVVLPQILTPGIIRKAVSGS